MRVLMVSKACTVAAYRSKMEELAALPDVDLTLVVPPYWKSGPRRSLLEPGHDRGYRMLVANPVFNGSFHLHFYPSLPALVSSIRPDILHVDEEPYDFVTFHAFRTVRRTGARVLFFTWQNFPRRYPPPFSWFENAVLGGVNGALAGNQDAARILREKGYGRPLYVIPQFGVDPELFHPGEPAQPPGSAGVERPLRIGFSGRLVEEKGLRCLLDAAAGLHVPWELHFIGDGPMRGELERLARRLGVRSRVSFLGPVRSEQVPHQLRQLDVLVNPSLTWSRGRTRWKEQFGRSLVEAMACGVPVIGSGSGEIPNVIGDAGVVVPEGDAAALREALERLARDPALRTHLGRRGVTRVQERYTQRRIARQTYDVYRQLLDQA